MNDSRYTVRRFEWFQQSYGDPYLRRLPNAWPVATFDTFDEAETHRRGREADVRAENNPFSFGGGSFFYQTSFDGPRLHDWLLDGGIEPPATQHTHRDWRWWWDAFAHTWNTEELAHAWSAFDKVRFYEVVEEKPGVIHIVLKIVWGRADNGIVFTAGTEGGNFEGAYRSERRAEAERLRRNNARAQGYGQYRYDRRRGYDPEPGRSWLASQAIFYETHAIPSDVPPFAGFGFLLQRRAITDGLDESWEQRPTAAHVPLELFANREAAIATRDEFATTYRNILNPFVFVDPDDGIAHGHGRTELELLKLPLPLPQDSLRKDWIEWWDLCQDDLTEELRTAMWEICDAPLFEVLRVEVNNE
jgi:hypothetical protein